MDQKNPREKIKNFFTAEERNQFLKIQIKISYFNIFLTKLNILSINLFQINENNIYFII